jgi:hypothetical protein
MKSRETGDGKAVGRKQGTPLPPAMEKQAGNKQPSEAQDLSGLSFEERMALYKQKYHKGNKPASQKQKPPRQMPSQKHPGSQRLPQHAKQEPKHTPAEQKPEKPAKKGILSRLLSKIIGKKGNNK